MAVEESPIKRSILPRENYLDAAKAIALFFVVLGHLVGARGTAYTWIFSFHMMLFFFISGYQFNADKYADYGFAAYFDKKVKSLLIPFAIVAAIGWAACLIIPDWRGAGKNVTYSLLYLTQPASLQVGQIWFLLGLFWTEIFFFYLYKKIFSKVSIATVIFIAILISVIGFNMNRVTFLHYPRIPWKIDSAVTALVFYIAGFYIKQAGWMNRLFRHKAASAVLMVLSGLLGFYIARYRNGYVNICDCQYGNYFYFYAAAFCGIAFILLLSKFCDRIRLLQYYGRNTLWMFALHSFLLSLSVYILNTITQKQYVRSGNIPFTDCLIIAALIYSVLGLIPFAVGFCREKLVRKTVLPLSRQSAG